MTFTYSSRFAENTGVRYEPCRSTNALNNSVLSVVQSNSYGAIRHCGFSETKFHDTARITREIPWYFKFHCEFPDVKFHGTTRIRRAKLHDTVPVSVALGSSMTFYGISCRAFPSQ